MGRKPDPLATMTRVDLLARIIELKDAVDWRDRKLAEKDREIAWLREQLAEARRKLSVQDGCGESPRLPQPPR